MPTKSNQQNYFVVVTLLFFSYSGKKALRKIKFGTYSWRPSWPFPDKNPELSNLSLNEIDLLQTDFNDFIEAKSESYIIIFINAVI